MLTLAIAARLSPGHGHWVAIVATALGEFALALLGWGALRSEGVRPADVGLSWAHVPVALLVLVILWVGGNLLAIVLIAVASDSVALGPPAGVPWPLWMASVAVDTVVVGPAEELAARAYLQNKLIALLGGGRSKPRAAIAIVLAALLFALWHIPQRRMVQHLSLSNAVLDSLSIIPTTLLFALLYAATRNVPLVGLIHGTIDAVPLVVLVPAGRPWVWAVIVASGLAAVIASAWLYRLWALRHRPQDFRPPVEAVVRPGTS